MKITTPLLAVSLCALLLGCQKHPTDPQDPYETLNRNMFKLNTCLDRTVLRPLATVYSHVIPHPIRKGVTNFFNNLFEPTVFINDLLQGKINFALIDVGRVIVNSTVGLAGLIDVGKHVGLPYHNNDFGKTFAYWSANKKSAYLVLPFWGPSTIRDTVGMPFAAATTPLFYIKNNFATYIPLGVYYVNLRSQLLPMDPLIDQAFDPYAAVRSAFLQHRNAQIAANDAQGDYNRHHPPAAEQTLDEYVANNEINNVSENAAAEMDYSFGNEK